MISLDQFYNNHVGRGMDYDGAPSNDPVQCVDLAKFWLHEGFGVNPGAWGDAYAYFDGAGANALRALGWQVIPNDHNNPNQVPPRGAVIVWARTLPGSGDGGHIAVCWSAAPGAATFISFDQNWGGKAAKLVTHNWSYVLGWLVPPSAPAAAPAPAPAAAVSTPQPQGDEMIATQDEAVKEYQLLRPNGGGNADEIAGTAGKRSYKQFLYDAQGEVQARNSNLQQQAQHMADLQSVIDSTNATITQLQTTIASDAVTNADKQKALDDALAKIAAYNTEMATLHDQVTDLQTKLADPVGAASAALNDVAGIAKNKAGKSGGFLVAFFKFIMQINLAKIFPKLKK